MNEIDLQEYTFLEFGEDRKISIDRDRIYGAVVNVLELEKYIAKKMKSYEHVDGLDSRPKTTKSKGVAQTSHSCC